MNESRARRTATLRAAAERKSEEAEAKARRAIMAMTARGAAIDFRSVALEAGVSTDFLYKNAALRSEIVSMRKPPPARIEARASATRSRDATNAVKLAVATAALRDLRHENEALRRENAMLRGDLAAERAKNPATVIGPAANA